jgi:hypothetical protein
LPPNDPPEQNENIRDIARSLRISPEAARSMMERQTAEPLDFETFGYLGDYPTRPENVDVAPWARTDERLIDFFSAKRQQQAPADPLSDFFKTKAAASLQTQAVSRNAAMMSAIATNPDQEAAIRKMASRMEMPVSLVRGMGMAEAQNKVARDNVNPANTPSLAKAYSQPDWAQLAIDDWEKLSDVERIIRQAGGWQNEISNARSQINEFEHKLFLGQPLRPSEQLKYQDLENRIRVLSQQQKAGETGPSYVLNVISGTATDVASSLPEMAIYGTVGLIGGPQGARYGAQVGSAFYNYRQIVGTTFKEYRNIRDQTTGEFIDQDVARGGAFINAIFSVGLETFADKVLLGLVVPGAEKFLSTPGKDVVSQLLQSEGGRNVMMRVGKKVATGAIVEAVTEAIQEGSAILGGETVKAVAPGDFAPISEEETRQRIQTAAIEGGIGGGGLAGIAAGPQIIIENRAIARAERELATSKGSVDAVERAVQAASESKLIARDRGELEKFIDDAAADGPVSTVYFSADDLANVAREAGLEPQQLAQQLGVTDQIQPASVTNALLEMPVGKFIATVADTDLAKPLIQVIKTNPFLLNRAEQEAYSSGGRQDIIAEADRLVQQALTDETFAAEAQSIQDEVLQQFRAFEGGEVFTPEVNRAYATITTQGYVSLARRMGISPREAYQKYQTGPLQIQRQAATEEGMGQPVLAQAKQVGYEGQSIGEAQEWVRAREKGLDMSQEGRLQRAQEMGFDTGRVVYHGSPYSIDAFDVTRGGELTKVDVAKEGIFLVDQPDIAAGYATTGLSLRAQNDVLPIARKVNSGETAYDFQGNKINPKTFDAMELVKERIETLRKEGMSEGATYPLVVRGNIKVVEGADQRLEGQKDFVKMFASLPADEIRRAKEEGYDGVRFVQTTDYGNVGDYTVIFDPSNIRSVNAAFDPEFAESANILAQDLIPPDIQAEMVRIYNENIGTEQEDIDRFINSRDAEKYNWNKITEQDLIDRIGEDEDVNATFPEAMEIIRQEGAAIEYGTDNNINYAAERDAPKRKEFYADAAYEEGWVKPRPETIDDILQIGVDEFAASQVMEYLAETEGWTATKVRKNYRYQTLEKEVAGGVVYLNVRISDHAKQSAVGHAVYGKDDIDINLAPSVGEGNEQYAADDFNSMLMKMREAEQRGPLDENILGQERELDAMGFYSAVQEAAVRIPDNIWAMGWQAARNAIAKGRGGLPPRRTEMEYLGLDAMFGDTEIRPGDNFPRKGAALKEAVLEHIAAKRLALVENFVRFDPNEKKMPSKRAMLEAMSPQALSSLINVEFQNQGDGRGKIVSDLGNPLYLYIQRKGEALASPTYYDLMQPQPGGEAKVIATGTIGDLDPIVGKMIFDANPERAVRRIDKDALAEAYQEGYASNLVRGPGDIRLPGEDVPMFEAVIGIPKGVPGAEYQAPVSHVGGKAKGTLVTAHGEERIDDKGQRTIFVGQVQSDIAQEAREKKDRVRGVEKASELSAEVMKASGIKDRRTALDYLYEIQEVDGRKTSQEYFDERWKNVNDHYVLSPALQEYARRNDMEFTFLPTAYDLEQANTYSPDRLRAPLITTSEWTNVAVRAMIYRAARQGFQSISFPTGQTSAIIQGNEEAVMHYETNVKGALEKIARQLGGEVRRGSVKYNPLDQAEWENLPQETAEKALASLWSRLPPVVRGTIRMNMPNMRKTDDGEFYVATASRPGKDDSGVGKDTYEWTFAREAKRNPLIAAYQIWVQGAMIFGQPGAFERLITAAGGPQGAVTEALQQAIAEGEPASAYILDLTPEMRSKIVTEGFPLFAPGRRAQYQPDLNRIMLLPKADWSSYLHEMGHHFLEVYNNAALQIMQTPEADRTPDEQELVDEMRLLLTDMARQAGTPITGDVLQWWANTPLDDRRPVHEKYAQATEKYFMEGKAPVPELQSLFDKFRDWLIETYKRLATALNVELSDEVRGVMDRMYAAHETVRTAEYNRKLVALFREKPEDMTEQQWTAYQQLAAQATDDAQSDLTARSLRDMQWLSGARARVLRRLQRENADKRKVVAAEVTAEVMAQPVNVARSFLRRGIAPNGEPVVGPHKLSIDLMKARYPETDVDGKLVRSIVFARLGYGQYGMLAKDGMDPDMAAELLGYPSGDALINDLLSAQPEDYVIKTETDRRMLERFGDLNDETKLSRAADEVIHSAMRAKVLQAEYAALSKAAKQTRPVALAAKEIAKEIVGRQVASKLNLNRYLAAERAAGRKAEAAMRSGDFRAAASAKRDQLLNFEVVREVQRVLKERNRALDLFSRINKAKRDTVAKTRNYDLVQAARAILAAYGFGSVKNKPTDYIKLIAEYNSTLFEALEPVINDAIKGKTLDQLTVAEFLGLHSTIKEIWDLSREEMKVQIEGRQEELSKILDEFDDQFVLLKVQAPTFPKESPTETEEKLREFTSIPSLARRIESLMRLFDLGKTGPFTKYIWRPVSEAAERYRADQSKYYSKLKDLFKEYESVFENTRGKISCNEPGEIGFTFKGGKPQLLHAIAHTGNASNKRKLLLGYGWGSLDQDGNLIDNAWQNTINRLARDGILTKADFDFVQKLWDINEEIKPLAQETHRKVFGAYFDEITAEEMQTPFGAYRGGYMPAITRKDVVPKDQKRAAQEILDTSQSAMFPAAPNGFTKTRNEQYAEALALNLNLIPQHVNKVLKFAHMAGAVKDVLKITNNKNFSRSLEAAYPGIDATAITPWLNRSVRQIIETPIANPALKHLDSFAGYLRTNSGIGIMFANLVNSIQNVTGITNAILRINPVYLARAHVNYTRNPFQMRKFINQASLMMTNRADTQVAAMNNTIQTVMRGKDVFNTVRDFSKQHAYFAQLAVQNTIDTITWMGAYDQAISKGETSSEAAKQADAIVRQTQGSSAAEDISYAETGPHFIRLFTHMYGYFNMLGNLYSTEIRIAFRSSGIKKGLGMLFFVYVAGYLPMSMLGGLIADGMRGQLPEEEEEEGWLGPWLEYYFNTQIKTATAFVPIFGQGIQGFFNAFNDKPYDDRVLQSPGVGAAETIIRTPFTVVEAITGEGDASKAIKDTLSLMTTLTGIPFQALGRPIGYAVDVAEGDIEPTSELDYIRGLVTGTASEASRQ